MNKNDGQISIILAEDELIPYLKSEKHMEILLKAYNQDPIYFNHQSGIKAKIDNPNMSICLSGYPRMINDLASLPLSVGVMERLLISYPNEKIKRRNPSILENGSEAFECFYSFIKRLLNWHTKKPIKLELSLDAIELLYQLKIELEKEFKNFKPELITWNKRMVNQLLRIAGLLHVTTHAVTAKSIEDVPVTIGKDTLLAAIRFKDYFITHKQRIYKEMNK